MPAKLGSIWPWKVAMLREEAGPLFKLGPIIAGLTPDLARKPLLTEQDMILWAGLGPFREVMPEDEPLAARASGCAGTG